MPPFIIPSTTPAQQAQRFQNNEVAFLVSKLVERRRGPFGRDLVVLCDSKFRRGTPGWMELARKLTRTARKAPAERKPKPRRNHPRPAPKTRTVLERQFRAKPTDFTLPEAQTARMIAYDLAHEDEALIYMGERRDMLAANAEALSEVAWEAAGYGDSLDFGTWSDDENDDREWVERGFRITTRPDLPLSHHAPELLMYLWSTPTSF